MTKSQPSSPSSSAKKKPVGDLSYKEALEELEAIVDEIDGPTLDLDQLAPRFQRAIDLVEELDNRIISTQDKLDQLAPRLESLGQLKGEE